MENTTARFPESDYPGLRRYLMLLFYAQCAALAAVLLGLASIPRLKTAFSIVSGVAGLFCLFSLGRFWKRYRKAFRLAAAQFALSLAGNLLGGMGILSMASSLCALLALYQEYTAHAEITTHPLSSKWHKLFNCQIGAIVFTGFLAPVAVTLGVLSGLPTEALATGGAHLIIAVSALIQVLYLCLLRRTAAAVQ